MNRGLGLCQVVSAGSVSFLLITIAPLTFSRPRLFKPSAPCKNVERERQHEASQGRLDASD